MSAVYSIVQKGPCPDRRWSGRNHGGQSKSSWCRGRCHRGGCCWGNEWL